MSVSVGVYRYVKVDLRVNSVCPMQLLQWRDVETFEVEPMKDISLVCGVSLIGASSDDEVSKMYPVEKYPYRYFYMQEKGVWSL